MAFKIPGPPSPPKVYTWTCAACGYVDWVTEHGTDNLGGSCYPHCAADDLHIHEVVGGRRVALGRASDYLAL